MSEDTNDASGLRKQYEDLLAETKELRTYKRQNELGTVLGEFGLDSKQGPGKFVTQAYDGEVSADAFRKWLEGEGFEAKSSDSTSETSEKPTGLEQRTEQQQKLTQLRDATASGTDQKVSGSELRQIAKTNPAKARELMAAGAVELKYV